MIVQSEQSSRTSASKGVQIPARTQLLAQTCLSESQLVTTPTRPTLLSSIASRPRLVAGMTQSSESISSWLPS